MLSESILNIQRSLKESDGRYHQSIIDDNEEVTKVEKTTIKELTFIRDNLVMVLGYLTETLSESRIPV